MAADKLVDSTQLDTDLTSVANAIRTKGGTSAALAFPAEFVSAIEAIETGGGSEIEEQLITGKYNGEIVTNNYTNVGRVFSNTTGSFSVRMPELAALNINAQIENSSISSFFAPKCILSNRDLFNNCANLSVVVYNYSTWYYYFASCPSLAVVDLQSSSGKIDNAFSRGNGCPALKTIILRGSSVTPLTNTTSFDKTPFASGGTGGTLYVPQALVSQYTQATNWSTILGYANNQILPIEGSIYETQYADGTPIT